MASRTAALARLRALRQSGKTAFESYQVQDAEDLYSTVDEEGYKKVVRSRLDEDDFVVDDNGAGYADDGREEDWQDGRGQTYDSESEDELPTKSKAGMSLPLGLLACRHLPLLAKRKREEDAEKAEKVKNGINKYFNANAATVAAPKAKVNIP